MPPRCRLRYVLPIVCLILSRFFAYLKTWNLQAIQADTEVDSKLKILDNDSNTASRASPKLDNRSAAQKALESGFYNNAKPVEGKRLEAINNLTCVVGDDTIQQDWQRRVPSVILLGTQKGGSTALAQYLYGHPSIVKVKKKELHFFDKKLDEYPNLIRNGTGIDSKRLIDYYQDKVIGKYIPLENLKLDKSLHILDATPNYLLASDRNFDRILCTCPWVKFLVLLRNPIERAFSQYKMQVRILNPEKRRDYPRTFEEYVKLDLDALEEVGIVLPNSTNQVEWEAVTGSPHEDAAWKQYTKLGINSPIGRGLYSIQIRQLFDAMKRYNKSTDDLMVIPSEDLLANTDAVYQRILKFLDFQPHRLDMYRLANSASNRSQTMNPKTRERLQQLFEPYNRKLASLLGQDWQGIWE
jgi:hypothetical protein